MLLFCWNKKEQKSPVPLLHDWSCHCSLAGQVTQCMFTGNFCWGIQKKKVYSHRACCLGQHCVQKWGRLLYSFPQPVLLLQEALSGHKSSCRLCDTKTKVVKPTASLQSRKRSSGYSHNMVVMAWACEGEVIGDLHLTTVINSQPLRGFRLAYCC